ncbi:14 kDa proline-rich protein DC2.15-like [Phalaenopsis equestris]|uniref:14 kDa proline-rich protein DC2.15-like n=1 Tax=Phalaenopsis equestris TaxID=78828 RepID=UPI0009E2F46A|nr:14 kDa proline-rich protein DC2.15-like [Phalaenopsis equestris]
MAAHTSTSLLFLFFLFSVATAAAILPSNPNPTPTPSINFPPKDPPVNPFCPRDVLKLASCVELLGVIDAAGGGGGRLSRKCCSLLDGLAAGEAAACLCTAIKETVAGINVEWDVGLSIVVSSCKKKVPDGFKCV